MKVPFNKPFVTGKEQDYIGDVIACKKLSGNGKYTKLCQNWFKEKFNAKHCLLTTSCTDALEMSSILADIQPGDEVIIPTYTFVSAANAFVLRGAKIVFVDSLAEHPNLDHTLLEELITEKTKAIVVVHYAGIACDMDAIMAIANKYDLVVIEDAAQAIGAKYKNKYLGTIGHFGAYSFHATKNIHCGEGGLLLVNDDKHIRRSEIIWEKGTNRAAFVRGEVDKYSWVDVGSSFLPSELNAAFLWAQLEFFESIFEKRIEIWNSYFENLTKLNTPVLPNYSTNNGHIFYIVCENLKHRIDISSYLKAHSIQAYFHFLSLHSSPYMNGCTLGSFPNADRFESCLLRLPIYNSMTPEEVQFVAQKLLSYKPNTKLT